MLSRSHSKRFCFTLRRRCDPILVILLLSILALTTVLVLLILYLYRGGTVVDWSEVPIVSLPPFPPPERAIGQPERNTAPVVISPPSTQTPSTPIYADDIPILLFTFNRANNLKQTLESLFSVRPAKGYPLYVSQDGNDSSVAEVIRSYGDKITHLHYQWKGKPDARFNTAYLKIAGHYEFGLKQIFDVEESFGHHYNRVILLEDDMLLAPDFFSYFRAMASLLDDPTLLCISAWNDNGNSKFVRDPTILYRTDCFPGLGWMMSRSLWMELRKWTWGFWDDWLREPAQRHDRSCIYPEINRVYTFGSQGSSGGQFYDEYLKPIKLNTDNIDWNKQQITYLRQVALKNKRYII